MFDDEESGNTTSTLSVGDKDDTVDYSKHQTHAGLDHLTDIPGYYDGLTEGLSDFSGKASTSTLSTQSHTSDDEKPTSALLGSGAYDEEPEIDEEEPEPTNEYINEEDSHVCDCASGVAFSFISKLPLKILLPLMGIGFIVAGLVDFILNLTGGVESVINIFLMVVGSAIVIVELPGKYSPQRCQTSLFYWSKCLTRLWGRALLYCVLATFAVADGTSQTAKFSLGIFAFLIVLFMILVSFTSAAKLKKMKVHVLQAEDDEDLKGKLEEKFEELDNSNRDVLTGSAITALAEEAGLELCTSELESILRFFDDDYHDEITIEQWVDGFREVQRGIRML